MATLRERPYPPFNFLVDLGTGSTDGPQAGFAEVSSIGMDVAVAEYRNGNSKENSVMKITGLNKATDVTLKRGIVDSKSLFDWIKDTRTNGPGGKKKSVTITLHDEAQAKVQSWVLANVIPMKYTGPTLAAKGGGDVAMEELVLAAEGMVIEK